MKLVSTDFGGGIGMDDLGGVDFVNGSRPSSIISEPVNQSRAVGVITCSRVTVTNSTVPHTPIHKASTPFHS